MTSAAYSARDPQALAGSVVGGRWRLERCLTSSDDTLIFSAIDTRSKQQVIVELARQAGRSEQHGSMLVDKIDEGVTDEGLWYSVLEHGSALHLGDWKLARRVCDTLAGTYWQTEDGSLLVELPARVSESPAGRRVTIRPPPGASARPSPGLVPRPPLEPSPPAPDPVIPIYVEEPPKSLETERPVVRETTDRDSLEPPAKRRTVPLVFMASLCVACALVGHVGWRAITSVLPSKSDSGSRAPAALERPPAGAPAQRTPVDRSVEHEAPAQARATNTAPLSRAARPVTAAEADAAAPEQTSAPSKAVARPARAKERPRRAASGGARPETGGVSSPYDYLPSEL